MADYKAGAILFEDYYQNTRPIGAVLEVPTGHTVQWRYRPETERPESTRRFRALAARRLSLARVKFWWDRVPALHRLGVEGIEDDPNRPPLDLLTPREWLVRRSLGAYSSTRLVFVPGEAVIDSFYEAVITDTVREVEGFAPPEDPTLLRPDYVGTFLRSGGYQITEPKGVPWLAETVEMLVDGVVGYRFVADEPVPIRAPERLGNLMRGEDRADRLRSLSSLDKLTPRSL